MVLPSLVGATDASSRARRGTLQTRRGAVETPAFMCVGTRATVTGLDPEELRASGAGIVLANTYHLLLRPGPELFRRVGGIQMRNLNAMTPETETTTHYFWAQAHDFEPHNPEMTEKIFQQIKTAFLQDVAVFTAQQKNIDLDPNAPQIDINADSGGIQARRIVDRLYAEEQAGKVAAATAAE